MENQKSSPKELVPSAPKDVFLHLLSIISLYISAGSLIALLFQYINALFPDALSPYTYYSIAGPVRWSMASLIIVFPFFISVSWFLHKDLRKNPEKRELKIRKWLINFTLFIAAMILITDLVTLVYNFLGGDLTARFLLKVAVFFVVIGSVFAYYFSDLRKQFKDKELKIWFFLTVSVVLASIIAGFFTAGSPLTARLYKFDEQRVNDLQMIQNEVVNYWINKNVLPKSLIDLKNDITGFVPPTDPETGQIYGYTAIDKMTFKLCADFNLVSAGNSLIETPMPARAYPYQQNWDHGQGKVCFSRTIDPAFYKNIREQKPAY